MPDNEKKVTHSWTAYQECISAVRRFLGEIRFEEGEAWVGDVCFGSPNRPLIRAPLARHSAELVRESVERTEGLAAMVLESIHVAVSTSRRVLEELQAAGQVQASDVTEVVGRITSLEQLLAQLQGATRGLDTACHPAQLLRWSEILRRSFEPGDGTILVRVVTTYVL